MSADTIRPVRGMSPPAPAFRARQGPIILHSGGNGMRMKLIALALCLAAVAFAHDITGKWDFNVETGAGAGSPSFVFKQTSDKLTGTYTGTFGTAEVTGSVKG